MTARRAVLGLGGVALAVVSAALTARLVVQQITRSDTAIPSEGAIARVARVELGGLAPALLVRRRPPAAPGGLWLRGGPGRW